MISPRVYSVINKCFLLVSVSFQVKVGLTLAGRAKFENSFADELEVEKVEVEKEELSSTAIFFFW